MMTLFAQAGGFNGRGNDDIPPEVLGGIICFAVVIFAIVLVIHILFLLTLSKCFSLIAPRNRLMEPGMVWLNLIPFVGIVWIFFTTQRLAESLRNEYDARRLRGDDDYGKSLGLIFPILNLCAAIPYVGALIGIGAFVCWILYWVKIAGYNRELESDGGYRRRGDDGDSGDDRYEADYRYK
jgi:hypothetical protein